MPFDLLISVFPEFIQLLSTAMDPHSLQMLRCTSKACRDGADKEQCTASAIAKYTRAVLHRDDGFFRLYSMYGCRKIDISPVYSDSGIDDLVCTYGMASSSYYLHGDRVNVIVTYDNGRRFIGFISGEFDNRTEFNVMNLGRDVFHADSRRSIDLSMYPKVWISMNDCDDEGDIICVRVNLDAGGLIGEVFADHCFYSV